MTLQFKVYNNGNFPLTEIDHLIKHQQLPLLVHAITGAHTNTASTDPRHHYKEYGFEFAPGVDISKLLSALTATGNGIVFVQLSS
jgi:hypothetical protein